MREFLFGPEGPVSNTLAGFQPPVGLRDQSAPFESARLHNQGRMDLLVMILDPSNHHALLNLREGVQNSPHIPRIDVESFGGHDHAVLSAFVVKEALRGQFSQIARMELSVPARIFPAAAPQILIGNAVPPDQNLAAGSDPRFLPLEDLSDGTPPDRSKLSFSWFPRLLNRRGTATNPRTRSQPRVPQLSPGLCSAMPPPRTSGINMPSE